MNRIIQSQIVSDMFSVSEKGELLMFTNSTSRMDVPFRYHELQDTILV